MAISLIRETVPQEEIRNGRDEKVPAGGKETLLLVDDDEVILEVGGEMLSEFGYTVLTASDGENALALFHQNQMKIDLVVLDVNMPGMGGRECLGELLKINPMAKVIITSGYSADRCAKEALGMGASGYISKPYGINQMLKTVRSVLDDQPGIRGAPLRAV